MLFEIDDHLHRDETDAKFKMTHLGQAHIAGTGPKGMTCRDCALFGKKKDGQLQNPGYYAATGLLKQSKCHSKMPGKSSRSFPHFAQACSLFEPSDAPWPVTDPNKS